MSRGRGGPYKEHYCRQTPSHLQVKDRPDQATDSPRPGPQQAPYPNYYNSSGHPGVPTQPPARLIPSSLSSSYSQNRDVTLTPNSFQYQQAAFLRGQSSEAPHYRGSPHKGRFFAPGRPASLGPQHQSGYSSYPNPGSSQRGRGGFRQNQKFALPHAAAEPPRGRYIPRHPNPNQHFNRQWDAKTDSVFENFQRLSFQEGPGGGSRKGNRRPSPSFNKVDIKLTPDIQDLVLSALVALKSDERIAAKVLAKKLRLPKSIVNKALYTLEHLQKATRQGLTPPEWSLYRKPVTVEKEPLSQVQYLSCEGFQNPEVRVETDTEVKFNCEFNFYSSSLSESSDSEEFPPPTTEQHRKQQNPSPTGSPKTELKVGMMSDQKELIMRYLFESGEATALVIAKNIGLKSTKQVNPTLYTLEKQGDITKNGKVNPPKWELSTHRKDRMERSLKAAQSIANAEVPMESSATRNNEEGSSTFVIPGLEPMLEDSIPKQSQSEAVTSISYYISNNVRR